MRRLLFFLTFLFFFGAGVQLTSLGRLRDIYRSICDLTESHFYKADNRLADWVLRCRTEAARLPLRANEKVLLGNVQGLMNELLVSHFQIYDPGEDKRLWKGESIDTGIRSRYVEDSLVVYRVEKTSAAERAGVKVGDEIIEIADAEQITPWGAMRRTGKFLLKRNGEEVQVEIQATSLTTDARPRLSPLSDQQALLTLDSFRAEYFEADQWKKMAERLMPYRHVIIDIRENAGGSFVAMLRALSTFHCAGKKIGTILQPRKTLPAKLSWDDDLSDAHQIQELEKFGSVVLRTFSGYGCFKGAVTVLMSSDTSSTAEIFAESFLHRPRARVWGMPTAGDVVLAVWYDLPALGPGYSVSIPEAVYLNQEHNELEGHGVRPQRELYYDLKSALRGEDNWITEASRRPF